MPHDRVDGPRRFISNWLAFDDARPARTTPAWRFLAVLAACLAATAVLAMVAGTR